jgi:hypothetical protein
MTELAGRVLLLRSWLIRLVEPAVRTARSTQSATHYRRLVVDPGLGWGMAQASGWVRTGDEAIRDPDALAEKYVITPGVTEHV